MKKKLTFAAALLAASVLGGMANAKQLVYCSEASPAGFDADLADVGAAFGLATALAVGAFGLSELAGFAAFLAFAFAGAVVLGAFATCPSLGCSCYLCLPAMSSPYDRVVSE